MEEKRSLQTCRIHALILQLQHQRQVLNDAFLLSGEDGWIQATLLHLDSYVKQVIITFTPGEDTDTIYLVWGFTVYGTPQVKGMVVHYKSYLQVQVIFQWRTNSFNYGICSAFSDSRRVRLHTIVWCYDNDPDNVATCSLGCSFRSHYVKTVISCGYLLQFCSWILEAWKKDKNPFKNWAIQVSVDLGQLSNPLSTGVKVFPSFTTLTHSRRVSSAEKGM